ncbi:MAG: hypothetical protein NXI12_06815 [Alphaproteobacteria bacterium]|nr:hypothetical protein [Alphaproteobacteria bacterium]
MTNLSLFASILFSLASFQSSGGENYVCDAQSNQVLCELYIADQADLNMAMEPNAYQEALQARLEQVEALVADGQVTTSWDYFHAAVLFHHSSSPSDWVTANIYAQSAVEAFPAHPTFRWLVAASWDRIALALSDAQIFGTQLNSDGSRYGRACTSAMLPSGLFERYAVQGHAMPQIEKCESSAEAQD